MAAPAHNYSILLVCFNFSLGWNLVLFCFVFFMIIIFFFTLQYCIGFAIHQHASAMGVHVFPNRILKSKSVYFLKPFVLKS